MSHRRFLLSFLGIAAALLLAACDMGGPGPGVVCESLFVDVAASAGLKPAEVKVRGGRFYMPEIMGPGAALFDFDGDGRLDIYLAQGRDLAAASPPSTPVGGEALTSRTSGPTGCCWLQQPDGSFVIPEQTEAGEPFPYRQRNQLFRNLGDGRFAKIPPEVAGVGFERLAAGRSLFRVVTACSGSRRVVPAEPLAGTHQWKRPVRPRLRRQVPRRR